MHSIWKGSISFGLVNIPVKVCGAVEAGQVSFHQVHSACMNRIKHKKYCPHCEREVSNDELIRGYQTPGGVIPITDGDLEQVALDSLKTVELAGFIKEKEVDSLFYQKPYYLLPDKSEQSYWLLYHALKKSGKAGIARFAVHSREHLALVRPARGSLTLCTLYYPDEIRDVEAIVKKPNAKQMELAMDLIKQQTVEFKPEQYKDRYAEALERMLARKQPEAPSSKPAEIGDLMEALRISLEQIKENQKSA